jgi:hypothetical protein
MIRMANRHDVVKGEEEGRGRAAEEKKDESWPTLARSCRVGNGFSDFSKCEQVKWAFPSVRVTLPLSSSQINQYLNLA